MLPAPYSELSVTVREPVNYSCTIGHLIFRSCRSQYFCLFKGRKRGANFKTPFKLKPEIPQALKARFEKCYFLSACLFCLKFQKKLSSPAWWANGFLWASYLSVAEDVWDLRIDLSSFWIPCWRDFYFYIVHMKYILWNKANNGTLEILWHLYLYSESKIYLFKNWINILVFTQIELAHVWLFHYPKS